MAVIFPIPHKSRYIPALNDFYAPLAAGLYNFNQTWNREVTVVEMSANIVYYIDNFSFAGNMAQETFLSAFSVIPTLVLSRSSDRQNIYSAPIKLLQFNPSQPSTCFAMSNRKDDILQATFNGILNQNADLIGVDPIHLEITYHIYAIEEGEYNRIFRSDIKPAYSMRLDQ